MQDTLSKQQQKYKPNHQQTGLPPHSALSIGGKTNKNSVQISPYTKLAQTSEPILGGQKPKGRKNSTFFKERIQLSLKLGKGDLKHNNLKKIIMKRQRNTIVMKEQTRNTEVQINEEEIGKLPEKEFRIMIVKMIKNLENKMKKNARIN